MKKPIKALKLSFFIILAVTSFIACDKDFSTLESDVLGEGNSNFNTKVDSLPIAAYNKKLEGLRINRLASNLLGFFYDPAYGTTTASIVAQVTPSSYSPNFGETPVIDSVAINIPYYSTVVDADTDGNSIYRLDSVFGNTEAKIKLSIYQNNYFLLEYDPSGSTSTQDYYSNASSSTENSILTPQGNTINFDEHVVDTIYQTNNFLPSAKPNFIGTATDTTRSAPAFHVKLESDEAKLFWKNTILDKEGDVVLDNPGDFKNYFRGLYLKAEAINNDGQMVLLNLANANITIHYTYGAADSRLQSTYTLNFSGNILNTFINDFNYPIEPPNTTEGDATLYLKGTEGSMAVVDLFSGMVECEDEDGTITMRTAFDCFKRTYRELDENGEYVEKINGNYPLKKLVNDAFLEVYEDSIKAVTGPYGTEYHKYDRLYAYDIKNSLPTVDYNLDPVESSASAFNSKIISLSQRDTITGKFKIRLTEHLKNILIRDSTSTKIGLVLSNNVNYINNAKILNPTDEVSNVPAAAIISPRGTVLHGNQSATEKKRLKLKIFYTEPK
ncbi:DUF4270 domain-containing protein [Tamlana crocina]|uniref:DUF4270 domain-containing protein n=1 Tax=Tamlana crocina TaxID=393006 RepID=A0ABX1DCA0_9FLAO|nr:DUF4270 domain-containing protein [Tamlana crocina]NJX15985.1 DUF4270 domain-containing protein [Tamlana crocina]